MKTKLFLFSIFIVGLISGYLIHTNTSDEFFKKFIPFFHTMSEQELKELQEIKEQIEKEGRIKQEKDNFTDFIMSRNRWISRESAEKITHLIFQYSEKYDVDRVLVLAIIGKESAYKKWTRGRLGEIGLMQIHKYVWLYDTENVINLKYVGIVNKEKDLWDEERNIESGVYILDRSRDVCMNWLKRNLLKERGYENVKQCMITRYNTHLNFPYYTDVINIISEYKTFIVAK